MALTFANETPTNPHDTILKEPSSLWSWTENITELNLSNRKLRELDESVRLPSSLSQLNLSNNLFEYVPENVMKLEKLQMLDLSYNSITYFDETPEFCHAIVKLYLNNNNLHGPPFWVWDENPKKLVFLNISCNKNILYSLCEDYKELFLQCKCLVTDFKVHNCNFGGSIDFLKTIVKVKTLTLGEHSTFCAKNNFENFPCASLTKCCDIERLLLCNINIYNLTVDIKCFKMLKEIDLSMNNISALPPEFCELECLEKCILSENRLIYLPDSLKKLKNLKHLELDNNELCMLADLSELPNLTYLDVYNNYIDVEVENYEDIEYLDFAQNLFVEPENGVYLYKKEKLRSKLLIKNRLDGNKTQILDEPDDKYSEQESNYDPSDLNDLNQVSIQTQEEPEFEEDWDSDDYWEPHFLLRYNSEPQKNAWVEYVEQKMREGNFCPMDWHTVPIMDQIQYNRQCHPEPPYIPEEGQFDDPPEKDD